MSPPPFFQNTSSPLAPWHMWGGTVELAVSYNTLGVPTQTQGQIARIQYRRPETWSFWFGWKVLDPILNTTDEDLDVYVKFDLILGIGRSQYSTYENVLVGNETDADDAGHFVKDTVRAAPGQRLPLTSFWTTVAPTRVAGFNSGPPPLESRYIDKFPAEDIQCVGSLGFIAGSTSLAGTIRVAMSAYFAPLSHLRPDWFAGVSPNFLGGEAGGT